MFETFRIFKNFEKPLVWKNFNTILILLKFEIFELKIFTCGDIRWYYTPIAYHLYHFHSLVRSSSVADENMRNIIW